MAYLSNARRFFLMALAVGALSSPLAPRAQAETAPLPGDELRPLYAMDADIADGKQLAQDSCAKCHNIDGVSAKEGVPHIAGQRPSYIYLELKAYQQGARANADMAAKVKFLSDDAIVKVAAYYASLDPAAPPKEPEPHFIDPAAAGKAAAAPCAKCHGENGISQTPGVPNLIGLYPKYLESTIAAYKSEDRKLDEKNAKMKTAIDALSDDDVKHIALYYSLQKDQLARAKTTVGEGAAAAGKEAVAKCVKCHGEGGLSTIPANPSLAGQEYAYVLNALRTYKDGTRDDDTMSPVAKKLEDGAMKDIAAYYAGLDPKPINVTKPLNADEWADKCDRCHGPNGNSIRPAVPSLASQRMDYLRAVLRDYRSGARKSGEMAAMSSVLTDDDIAAIAAHYAYRKARTVIFVPAPTK